VGWVGDRKMSLIEMLPLDEVAYSENGEFENFRGIKNEQKTITCNVRSYARRWPICDRNYC
jgi:hypothetical protein